MCVSRTKADADYTSSAVVLDPRANSIRFKFGHSESECETMLLAAAAADAACLSGSGGSRLVP